MYYNIEDIYCISDPTSSFLFDLSFHSPKDIAKITKPPTTNIVAITPVEYSFLLERKVSILLYLQHCL